MGLSVDAKLEQIALGKSLDALAIPRIAELGIKEAYRRSMLEVDAMAAERFPVTRKEPPFRLTPPRGRA